MTDIILRFFDSDLKVYAVNPEYIAFNTEPCTDMVLTFDTAGKLVTAQLVKRNEEQPSSDT